MLVKIFLIALAYLFAACLLVNDSDLRAGLMLRGFALSRAASPRKLLFYYVANALRAFAT